jgi:hypothetical protein
LNQLVDLTTFYSDRHAFLISIDTHALGHLAASELSFDDGARTADLNGSFLHFCPAPVEAIVAA